MVDKYKDAKQELSTDAQFRSACGKRDDEQLMETVRYCVDESCCK
jgi:hypothetical protein